MPISSLVMFTEDRIGEDGWKQVGRQACGSDIDCLPPILDR